MAEENIHALHRRRMREEFLAGGLEGWKNHRVLELLLFHAIPQKDVNPLAHALINRFGSLTGVLHATREQLMSVRGVGRNTVVLLKLILAVSIYCQKEHPDLHGIYRTSFQFQDLLLNQFTDARNELVYMVCLDGKFKLLNLQKIGEGIADAAAITTRKVMETALACNASIVVLAHNHVSGLALPSTEDVLTTQHLKKSLFQVGIQLYDHFVVADGDMISMRDSGYLAE